MGAASRVQTTRNTQPDLDDYISTTPNRLWLYVTIAIGVLAIGLFVLYPLLAFNWRSQPFLGVSLSRTMVVDAGRSASPGEWTGLRAGLQHFDHIIAINGQQLASTPTDYTTAHARYRQLISTLPPESTVIVTFDRPAVRGVVRTNNLETCGPVQNEIARCEISYRLQKFPEADFLVYFVIPYVSGLIVLILGLSILWLRPNQTVALLASTACLLLALFMGSVFDFGVTQALPQVWLVATCFIGGTLTSFGLLFPNTLTVIFQRPLLRFVPFIISLIMAGIVLFLWYTPSTPQAYGRAASVATGAAMAGMVALLWCMLYQRRTAISLTIRDQSNSILIGIGIVIVPLCIWLLSRLIQEALPLPVEAAMPFFVPAASSIAYAVLQYRRLDTDKILSQSIAYTIMLGALILGYFLLVLGVSLVARQALNEAASNPLLIALTIFIIAVLFLPIRTRLQERIDRIYFRERRSYQEKAEEFTQNLTRLVGYGQIIREFEDLLSYTVGPTNTFIFLPDRESGDFSAFGPIKPPTDMRFAKSSGVVSLLRLGDQAIYLEPNRQWPVELRVDRARLNILKALFIAGISSNDQLNGFVLVGPPRSGAGRYNFEELRFLMNVIRQFGIAIERAQVIDSLQQRVRELDVLSQVGQAVNFTIKFDDLLELISAQTSKLIDAAYFYIALHDPSVDQLYFAFFLENDDRYSEKENLRWNKGRDLFSEIVRTNQPIRVDDYARAMAERNVKIIHENSNLKAWMGVPLVAGPRTLGVIAVGKTIPGETYSDEQLKIFGDIGALAATSIDKARLFAETERRARQLNVLNEISRQLVATESDVEKLLEIITSSAVDILGAEAGSLLLTADDSSGDLEFKVAVGGSGQELVGSRLPAGKGLVGKVAETGRHVIQNDAAHDPRHAAVTEFRTKSVLAVPLTAKDKVIGVLEVLNKKDGTIYVEQDVELLTTFAGQAAIAIENARLFEMTDLQLTKRIQELEILERIDTELNRTLDLNKVAEITVRWAIVNSGAAAGLLGLVVGSPPQLLIVAKYGYEAEDFPEGAEDMLWPLDRGIVKRVIRTRQADLVTDTSIDPDYIPSLRDALSQITIPMKAGDEINALLILETNRPPRLNLSDWGFAQRLAEHASIAIQNAQLYEQLTKAMESKSEFMGFAAHELKNPLASVKGFTDVLLSGMTGHLDEQQRSFLSIIKTNASRIQTIIDDLRDAAKADAGQLVVEPTPISFWNVVIETLQPFQKQLDDKRQEIVNNVSENLPLVIGDQTRLIQVMTNLISNAHKYSPPESQIIINAVVEPDYRDPKGNKLGDVLHISVADSGIGMSEEDLAKLFKVQYFRSENPLTREQPGTGLGMMITRKIIEGHNGYIWVESQLNAGTTFHFVLPVATETARSAEPASD